MKEIGGYFELESNNFNSIYHDKAIAINTARNGLEYILLINNYKKIHLPYYTCDVTLQPLIKLNVDFEFYYLDDEFNPIIKSINDDEVLLYVNYYGLMNKVIENLKTRFDNLIIDNAQAFYTKPLSGISTIYSARKFFGLSDGGFVYPNTKKKLELKIDKSYDRFSHLLARVEYGAEYGYELFLKNDLNLDNQPLKEMSFLTKKLLKNIDFDMALQRRNKNFFQLHESLKSINQFTPIIDSQEVNGAMVYPFLKKENYKLRPKLIQNKVFVAKYWQNVLDWLKGEDCFESYLVNNLIPLPIDQRYEKVEMDRIINIILD